MNAAKRIRVSIAAASAVAVLAGCGTASADPKLPPPGSAAPAPPETGTTKGGPNLTRVIVQVKAAKSESEQAEAVAQVESLARELGARRTEPMKGIPLLVIELPENRIDELSRSPQVERVQRDRPDRPL